MESLNPKFLPMAAQKSVLGPTRSYSRYLRSAQGRFPLHKPQHDLPIFSGYLHSSASLQLGELPASAYFSFNY